MLLHLLEWCCWFIRPTLRGPEGGGRINRNTTTKGVIKCLLPLIGRCLETPARAKMARHYRIYYLQKDTRTRSRTSRVAESCGWLGAGERERRDQTRLPRAQRWQKRPRPFVWKWMGGILKTTQCRRAVQLKRRKLSLSLNRKEPCSTERFVFLDNVKAEALNKRYVPKNTEKSTQWALSTFRSWRDKRNDHFREEADKQVPADLLASSDHAFKLVSPTKSFRRGQVICLWMDCGNMNVLDY